MAEAQVGRDRQAWRLRSDGETAHRLADAIDRYIAESEREIRRTKAQVQSANKLYESARMDCSAIGSQEIVAFGQELRMGGRMPQTINTSLSQLSSIFQISTP